MKSSMLLFPKHIDLSAYHYILNNHNFLSSMWVTVFTTVIGTGFSLVLTCAMAYAFSQNNFPGKKFFWIFVIFTMFFNGGLIPYYIVLKNLGFVNQISSMIIPIGINTFNMLVIKSFFEQTPISLREAATIDGANDVVVFVKIILPISKPVIATFSLYYAVFYWNQWWQGMLFIQNADMKPLQLFLRELINNLDISEMERAYMSFEKNGMNVAGQSVKMATLFVATLPILCVYPFLQKYFAKGIMIGAVKG